MHWRLAWPWTSFLFLLVCLDESTIPSTNSPGGVAFAASWTAHRKLDAREKTRDLWNHGFNNYMTFAFPLDELTPLSCSGRGPDWENPQNYGRNDVAGNFSLTLIDVLDTFVVLNDKPGFERAVRNVTDWVTFNVNTKPQVFETTIRVLGGLLSGHIFASDSKHPFHLPWYRGELLDLAHDLGQRLLPAFSTPTGIPYARLNLRHGVQRFESIETCTAGAGSLILEFATLSRLTNDERFEKAAFKAFFALWNRRSDLGLVGNTINTWTGKWLQPEVTGIGAGVDSFYEYALKWYVMSGEVEFLDVWHEAYAAIMRYARGADGFWFRSANIHTGDVAYSTTDSLSAFWSGLQVLGGDVENAIKSHLIYWNIWKRHSGLPEVWDINFMQATSLQYPLRPEFIESTYYLYRATSDPFYLDVGEQVLYDIIHRAKVDCGLTGISDLRNNKRDDRMESFVLSETLKYLFLLFDDDNPLHKDDSNFVFTTEGHILTLDSKHLKPLSPTRRKLRRSENLQCPAYKPLMEGTDGRQNSSGLVRGVYSRPDLDYVRTLVGTLATEAEERAWSPNSRCEIPDVELYSYDFILSSYGKIVPEDLNPSLQKLVEVEEGFILQNITGIRTHIVSRLDGQGYDVVRLGPHAVLRGQIVYVNDTDLILGPSDGKTPVGRPQDVQLRFFLSITDPMMQTQSLLQQAADEVVVTAYPAMFGGDPASPPRIDQQPLRFGHGNGTRVTRVPKNPFGCAPYASGVLPKDSIVLLHRGECTFLEKLMNAAHSGASGIVVVSNDNVPINPSADQNDADAETPLLDEVVAVVVTEKVGAVLAEMLDLAETRGFSEVMVAVDPEGQSTATETGENPHRKTVQKDRFVDSGRVLYLNGHPLLNTRLLI